MTDNIRHAAPVDTLPTITRHAAPRADDQAVPLHARTLDLHIRCEVTRAAIDRSNPTARRFHERVTLNAMIDACREGPPAFAVVDVEAIAPRVRAVLRDLGYVPDPDPANRGHWIRPAASGQ